MWFRNVKGAFLELFKCTSLLSILVQIDRLGNALCGGNPKTTISGRTGFFAFTKKNPYWTLLEKIINFTFLPIDGPGHCYQTWRKEKNFKHRRSSDPSLIALSLLIILVCPIISIVTYGHYINEKRKG